MRILHIISGLGVGGAETLLYRLIRESQVDGTEHTVVSLSSLDRIRTLGVEVRILGMQRGAPQPLLLGRMVNWIVAFKPDIVQAWMYHADLFGGIAAHAARRILARREKGASRFSCYGPSIKPSFRPSAPDQSLGSLRNVAQWCRRKSLTSLFAAPIRRKQTTFEVATALSGCMSYGTADIDLFRPLESARIRLRKSLGVEDEVPIVGIDGRYHAVKDYGNFVAAIGRVHRQLPKCQYVMIGQDLDRDNRALLNLLEEAGVCGACHLLGPRDDLQLLIPGFDVFCLSSRSEGFPTVVGEAMACGVPCVATDVGDTALLVGNLGRIVPRENSEALARTIVGAHAVHGRAKESGEVGAPAHPLALFDRVNLATLQTSV